MPDPLIRRQGDRNLGSRESRGFVAGIALVLVVWARLHPPTFDRWAAPWLRRYWRRWTVYRGRRWTGVLVDCDLVRDNRRTGQLMVPRVVRVRSRTRSIDTLYVR